MLEKSQIGTKGIQTFSIRKKQTKGNKLRSDESKARISNDVCVRHVSKDAPRPLFESDSESDDSDREKVSQWISREEDEAWGDALDF